MFLNKLGVIIKDEWLKTTQLPKNVKLGEYIIVPNHFRGIIILEDKGNKEDTACRAGLSIIKIKIKRNFGKEN